MAWKKWMRRKLPIDINKAKELKKKLKDCVNSIESKRLTIIIAYLNWSTIPQVQKTLWVSSDTICNNVKRYVEDPENFYKTKYPWRQQLKLSSKNRHYLV